MESRCEFEELLTTSVRRYARRYRPELERLELDESPEESGTIIAEAAREAEALGWLAAVSSDSDDAGAETSARSLATIVRSLAEISPSFAARLLVHHFCRECTVRARFEGASPPERIEPAAGWMGLESSLSDTRFAPSLYLDRTNSKASLNGTARLVLGGDLARYWLALARDSGGACTLLRVPSSAIRRLEPVATLGLRGLGAIDAHLGEVGTTCFEVLANGNEVHVCLTRARCAVGLAYIELLQTILEQTHSIAYTHAQVRRQNGTTLAQIPAVALHLMELERALAALRLSAQAYDTSPEDTWTALPTLISAARSAADSAIQVMGGAGYIVGHGVERHWRDVLQLGQLFTAIPW